MTILEGRGLFWWADDPIPAQQFAPNSAISGLLKIDDDGSSSLELDGYLPNGHGPMATMVQRELPADTCIRGLLKGSVEHILLVGPTRNGNHVRPNGISYERYIASACLVSEHSPVPAKLTFKQLIVPLSGYEQWLRLHELKVARTRRTASVRYRQPKAARYRLADGSLTIHFELGGQTSGALFGAEVTMKETASASFRFSKPLDLDGIQIQYQLFGDLLILLTGADYVLDWPSVAIANESRCRLYFVRLSDRTAGAAPQYFECVTNFVQLRESFGSTWEAWKSKREELGPGLYLYLGTRRGLRMYVEHRFVNLVWGIEAFHRRKFTISPATPLKEKVDRILAQIARSSDKRWLSKKLENAAEPSLGERIFEAISAVPVGLDAARLRAFSDACAELRNDISHFGGQRQHGSSYQEFMTKVHHHSETLAILYHMLLLHEIGIKEEVLKRWVFEGFRSYHIKANLARAGLLDESVVHLKPPEATSPT